MNKHTQLSYKILKILGIGALITVMSILSPALPYTLLREYIKRKLGSKYTARQINTSLKYLKHKKFIAFKFQENKLKIIVTKLGLRRLAKLSLNEITIDPVAWDGRWRLLTFDIPENLKSARQAFRCKLKELGFFHFQRSVFILPYPCELELNEISDILSIREHMYLLTCDRFAGDQPLIKKFKLKS